MTAEDNWDDDDDEVTEEKKKDPVLGQIPPDMLKEFIYIRKAIQDEHKKMHRASHQMKIQTQRFDLLFDEALQFIEDEDTRDKATFGHKKVSINQHTGEIVTDDDSSGIEEMIKRQLQSMGAPMDAMPSNFPFAFMLANQKDFNNMFKDRKDLH